MKKLIALLMIGITGAMVLSACATTKGAAVGACIGAIAGDTKKGAAIGAAVGTVVGILD
jgi:predicted small secreted protein